MKKLLVMAVAVMLAVSLAGQVQAESYNLSNGLENGKWVEYLINGNHGEPGNILGAASVGATYNPGAGQWENYQWYLTGFVLQSVTALEGGWYESIYQNGWLRLAAGPWGTPPGGEYFLAGFTGTNLSRLDGDGNLEFHFTASALDGGQSINIAGDFWGTLGDNYWNFSQGEEFPDGSGNIRPYPGHGGVWFENLSISSSQVPIPGAVWLLGSGLMGLFGLRRKLVG